MVFLYASLGWFLFKSVRNGSRNVWAATSILFLNAAVKLQEVNMLITKAFIAGGGSTIEYAASCCSRLVNLSLPETCYWPLPCQGLQLRIPFDWLHSSTVCHLLATQLAPPNIRCQLGTWLAPCLHVRLQEHCNASSCYPQKCILHSFSLAWGWHRCVLYPSCIDWKKSE